MDIAMKKPIVTIKVGSNVLLGDGHTLNEEILNRLISNISEWRKHVHVVFVSSGAAAAGKEVLGYSSNSFSRASLSAIGQIKLMQKYSEICKIHKITPAQLLISQSQLVNRENYLEIRERFEDLLSHDVLPIINENDAVAFQRGGFGDNDALAVYSAILSRSERVVFLTNMDGLYSSDPRNDPNAELISCVENIDKEITDMCSRGLSESGRGGMLSKLRAAKMATTAGIDAHIINGLKESSLRELLNKEKVGTFFPAERTPLSEKKLWLLLGATSGGQIVVDDGARDALLKRKSLLAVGVIRVRGDFEKKEFVTIIDKKGETIAFGVVEYSSEKLKEVLSLKEKEALKKEFSRELIHSDNLILLR